MKVLSLFSNIGVAEAYLEEIGVNVVLANELVRRRAELYSKIYPKTEVIIGDINEKEVFLNIVTKSINYGIDVILATPPCQGMSNAGQQKEDDFRNELIIPVIDIIKKVKPKYVFIENVPNFLNTKITYNGNEVIIEELIKTNFEGEYEFDIQVINTKDYSVPQTRERAIILMSKVGHKKWNIPPKETKIVTMFDAIGDLPSIDPFVKDISEDELLELFPLFYERKEAALKISPWNNPPHHIKRQVVVMMHTPTGKSAFDNTHYIPRKSNGEPVKGYKNTYSRQNWDTPAYTVTMDNRKISSQNNVHPGRYLGQSKEGYDIYSDARALTLYELMRITSLPASWNIPLGTSEAFVRSIIGEGIPPLFVKKTFENLTR